VNEAFNFTASDLFYTPTLTERFNTDLSDKKASG